MTVERAANFACPCGHNEFPRPYLETLRDIGRETPPAFIHSCFTVGRARKRQLQDYCLCLDAWLAGVPPGPVAAELSALGYRRIDWPRACTDLWSVLGRHDEWKDALVERVLHHLRYWTKSTAWDDDRASEFGRDQFLGPIEEDDGAAATERYGGILLPSPGFDEAASPRVRQLDERLAALAPAGVEWAREWVHEWWPCAPKAFRYLERKLWYAGHQQLDHGLEVPGFLQCEDTYPDHDQAAQWWNEFTPALEGWWRGAPLTGCVADQVSGVLGQPTPLKSWLARLFAYKLSRLVENGEQLTSLVRPNHAHQRGTKPLSLEL